MMDVAVREIRWLKRLMEELGDDREAMDNQKDTTTDTTTEAEEDDSELDRLLRHAMLLVRGKPSKTMSRVGEVEEPADEEEDEELDELLQRAATRLRQRLTQQSEQEEDQELDRLLRRAMTLFTERRKRLVTGQNEWDAKGVTLSKATTGSTSPGITDDEDDDDDELDSLLRRAMWLLRRRLREPSSVQEPNPPTQTLPVPEVSPLEGRKVLRQQLTENLKRPRDGEVSTERKNKRARCLSELQEDSDVDIPTEAQTNESSSLLATTRRHSIEAMEIIPTTETSHDRPSHIRQNASQGVTVNSASNFPQTIALKGDDELKILRASNTKLMEENADLKQKLQQQKIDSSSDARMVILLQEQVQRLQQRELELMRALSRSAC